MFSFSDLITQHQSHLFDCLPVTTYPYMAQAWKNLIRSSPLHPLIWRIKPSQAQQTIGMSTLSLDLPGSKETEAREMHGVNNPSSQANAPSMG
jgi:hypothetical protein